MRTRRSYKTLHALFTSLRWQSHRNIRNCGILFLPIFVRQIGGGETRPLRLRGSGEATKFAAFAISDLTAEIL